MAMIAGVSVLMAAACAMLLLMLPRAEACIYEFGTDRGKEEAPYTYSYKGDDWPVAFPQCSGQRQSPILLPGNTDKLPRVRGSDESKFNYGVLTSNGNNLQLLNNGHTVQLILPQDWAPDVRIAVHGNRATAKPTSIVTGDERGPRFYVRAKPAQLHFHTHSEHVVGGRRYPLEMHIVHFVTSDELPSCTGMGCPVVLGVLLRQADDNAEPNPFVKTLFDAMPYREGESATLDGSVLDFSKILPSDRTYVTYEGSLTTPPSEGIAWHVLTKPVDVTLEQIKQFELAVGDTKCKEEEGTVNNLSGSVGNIVGSATGQASPNGYQLPSEALYEDGCYKLGGGHNARLTVPRYGRPVKVSIA